MTTSTAPGGTSPRVPRRADDDRGGSSVEYGLLAAGVAAVIAVIIFAFGDNISDLFDDTCDKVASEASQTSC